MNTKIDTAHLRQVALTRFDVQLLSLLMNCGGEYPMPDTVEGKALVQTTQGKNLVEIIERVGERANVRLTDEGRRVIDQLTTMNKQPKIEVVNR